jgi:DNA-binding CsgD family transcriptional regulator
VALAVFRGREAEARELIDAAADEVVRRGEGEGLTFVRWATAVLQNGRGRYDEAAQAAERAAGASPAVWFSTWAVVELIEAASRGDQAGRAHDALERLSESTRASGTAWALGVELRSRALLSRGVDAEGCYREAIDALGTTRVRVELACAHLVHGEWLRRERRRLDARSELRRAHGLFTECGMEGFAERARRELEATGERARKRTVATAADLTAQEAQVARLAGEGATNQEIAAQLYIRTKTVEYHLHKTYRNLGVRSRTELARRIMPSR